MVSAYAAWAAWVASRATAASTGKSRQKSRNNLAGLFRDFRMGFSLVCDFWEGMKQRACQTLYFERLALKRP